MNDLRARALNASRAPYNADDQFSPAFRGPSRSSVVQREHSGHSFCFCISCYCMHSGCPVWVVLVLPTICQSASQHLELIKLAGLRFRVCSPSIDHPASNATLPAASLNFIGTCILACPHMSTLEQYHHLR